MKNYNTIEVPLLKELYDKYQDGITSLSETINQFQAESITLWFNDDGIGMLCIREEIKLLKSLEESLLDFNAKKVLEILEFFPSSLLKQVPKEIMNFVKLF